MVSIEVTNEETTIDETDERKKKKKKKKKKNEMKKPIMETLKSITRNDPYWKTLVHECDKTLTEFSTIHGQSIDEDYDTFKQKLTEAVSSSLVITKPQRRILIARIRSNPELKDLRKQKKEAFHKMKSEKEEEKKASWKKELSKVSRKLKRQTRKTVNTFKREQASEIESLEPEDCRRMWKELKKLARWTKKDKTPDTVRNEKNEEVSGEGILEVWKESFRLLGVEDRKDDKFDVEFGESVVKEQEEIEAESYHSHNYNQELDTPIHPTEITGAIRRLKQGKAAGNDEVVAEVLKKGGDQVEYSMYLLCSKVWNEEKLPTDWTRGMIFPIYKDGDEKDTSNYRGITLLSIVGKVYAQVINERLMMWCERHKILVEEQGGFRPHRGCPDQLFSLVEVLKNRGDKGTFCCFIDVKKAFDRVFRAGLWKRIAEEGVKGKMWRVLKSIYETVESCVKVNGSLTDWFPIETGVRQGCVLSPLLYAIFINGLVKELNELNIGVEIEKEGKTLSSLLYADDIVLIADDRYNLQTMLNTVTKYAKKWRFELNPKKSEVVVFGQKYAPRNIKWKLGDKIIKQVTQYKYLGIELNRKLNWSPYLKRVLGKARRNMTRSMAMGIKGGFLTPRLANILWMSLVRSIIEYGCEIWGNTSSTHLEKIQLDMGKRILRCGSRMSEEVVRGEMGWERQKARSDEMRLRYWAKIIRMEDDRIVKRIYRESRNRMEKEEVEKRENENIKMTKTWCMYTRNLMRKLKLETEWNLEQVKEEEEWNEIVRERIHEREEKKWRKNCLLKPKLRTYVQLKTKLRTEPFLTVYHRSGIPELVKLRGGSNRLRIEQGRYRKETVEQRICEVCDSKEVENEEHFMLNCHAYRDLREKMWQEIEKITGRDRASYESDIERLNALIGDKYQPEENSDKNSAQTKQYEKIARIVMTFVTTAMNRRRGLQSE
jgi:hypothetical protein